MKYINIKEGVFLSRPNRFVAHVLINGKEEIAHVKNTGRCNELLVPGTLVYLEDFTNNMGHRKLAYSVVAVSKAGKLLINMDSQAPNKAVAEALNDGRIKLDSLDELSLIKAEQTYGDSRFDFYVEDINGEKAFIEVKGVTLEEDGICRFPDAPTERGLKHVGELTSSKASGYESFIIFVIQMKGVCAFQPNDATHKAFGDALRKASKSGVKILAYDCIVTPNSMEIDESVPIFL